MAGAVVHRPIKYINGTWGKQMGLKEPRKGSRKLMGIMWSSKVRMGHNRPEVMK